MCGIAGFCSPGLRGIEGSIRRMTDTIAHRGPDGAGYWTDTEAGVALGHRRLAILDLSDAGRQPMHSDDGRYVLVFNGEIYNHKELRHELDSSGLAGSWRGHSDTETLLKALAVWGVERTLERLNGMFAFALWDRRERSLTIARDRLGEKPLYYCSTSNGWLLGSELRALAAHPGWRSELDRDALALFLRYGYVPDPWSIYEGVRKLPAGTFLRLSMEKEPGEPKSYWTLTRSAYREREYIDDHAAIAEADAKLRRAVAIRMEADVPLGAFLSGGIDSSLVVALMQAQSSRPVKSFSIGFDVPGYNEAEEAKAVATRLGTEHHELYAAPEDALALVPHLPDVWDEPFADSSQLPTLLLSRMTHAHVTVALSGDGGDEVFGGYNRYGPGYALYKKLCRLPPGSRRMISRGLGLVPVRSINHAARALPARLRPAALGERLDKLRSVLDVASDESYYQFLVSIGPIRHGVLSAGGETPSLASTPDLWPAFSDFRETMMYLDTLTYLPGDILAKVDRATMSAGLEARAPYLDHELIEFAWSLPMHLKIRDGETKWLLRQVLKRYLPEAMFTRPKMGFAVPLRYWLNGPLRDWAEQLLEPGRIASEGYLNAAAVQRLWTQYRQGQSGLAHQLWIILMFQAWLERTMALRPPPRAASGA